MSTLAVGTIKSVSSAAPVFQNTSGTEKGQLVKAWVNFDGTSAGTNKTIRDSLNISTVAETGTGQYTVTFTNAMSDTNYCVVESTNNVGGNSNACFVKVESYTTTSFSIVVVASAAFTDISICCMAVLGAN
tara:strand:- start:1509 stop:1901 length:393 start_codon:yes stop_codon:yes gene_type:complete